MKLKQLMQFIKSNFWLLLSIIWCILFFISVVFYWNDLVLFVLDHCISRPKLILGFIDDRCTSTRIFNECPMKSLIKESIDKGLIPEDIEYLFTEDCKGVYPEGVVRHRIRPDDPKAMSPEVRKIADSMLGGIEFDINKLAPAPVSIRDKAKASHLSYDYSSLLFDPHKIPEFDKNYCKFVDDYRKMADVPVTEVDKIADVPVTEVDKIADAPVKASDLLYDYSSLPWNPHKVTKLEEAFCKLMDDFNKELHAIIERANDPDLQLVLDFNEAHRKWSAINNIPMDAFKGTIVEVLDIYPDVVDKILSDLPAEEAAFCKQLVYAYCRELDNLVAHKYHMSNVTVWVSPVFGDVSYIYSLMCKCNSLKSKSIPELIIYFSQPIILYSALEPYYIDPNSKWFTVFFVEIYFVIFIIFILVLGFFLKNCIQSIYNWKKFMFFTISGLSIQLVLLIGLLIWIFPVEFNGPVCFLYWGNNICYSQIIIWVKIFICVLSICYFISIWDYFNYEQFFSLEIPILILLCLEGTFLLLISNNLFLIYLALELQSLALYILASIKRYSNMSIEAGLKYFIFGSFASGLLLFGISLIYGFSGTTNIYELYNILYLSSSSDISIGILFGYLFIMIGIFFKLGIVPFHYWLVDVYEGSPLLITYFFSIIPKIAILVLFYRIFIFVFILVIY